MPGLLIAETWIKMPQSFQHDATLETSLLTKDAQLDSILIGKTGTQAHRMLDDILKQHKDIRERPVWQPIPDEVRDRFRERGSASASLLLPKFTRSS